MTMVELYTILFILRNSEKMKRNIKVSWLIALAVLLSSASIASPTQGNHLVDKNLVFSDTAMLARTLASAVPREAEKPNSSPLRFDATYGRNYFEIIWNTLSSVGCDHFEIERSFDGVKFQKMGVVKGKTPCSRKDNFFYRDNVRPSTGRNNDFYYRLKQVDVNGHFAYSKMLIARIYNSKSLAALTITPDPEMNDILVDAQLKERSFVVMKLSDNNGNEVMRKAEFGDNGFNTYKMDDTSKLKPGTYSFEVIINSNERMTLKLVKA
jgi:hypothetical protein